MEEYNLIIYYNGNSLTDENIEGYEEYYVPCANQNCEFVKAGGKYAMIKDNASYVLYDANSEEIILKDLDLKEFEFSMFEINGTYQTDFLVYTLNNDIINVYDLESKNVTITGDYKQVSTSSKRRPGNDYVIIMDKDDKFKIANYKTGEFLPDLSFDKIECGPDGYCVFNENEVYNYNTKEYLFKKGSYEKIYLACEDKISVLNNDPSE